MPKVSDKHYTRHEERQGAARAPDRKQAVGVHPASEDPVIDNRTNQKQIAMNKRRHLKMLLAGWAVTPSSVLQREQQATREHLYIMM